MPCCCESNVKAAFVLGIIFSVLNIVGLIVQRDVQSIVAGIIFALVNLILVFGAHKRNKEAILVWIILAAIQTLILAVFAILIIIGVAGIGGFVGQDPRVDAAFSILIIALIIYIAIVALLIWTMIVANRARKEIMNPNVNKA